MVKNTKAIWLVVGIIVVVLFIVLPKSGLFAVGSGATMTRTASTVTPGQTFTLTYSVSGAPAKWGAIINDNVAGGCTFPAGTNYKDAMLSTSGNTKTISVTAPTSGSCTFTGYYQFDTDTTSTPFQVLTVSVCQPTTTCAANTCTGSTCSNGCGGTVPGTKTPICTRPTNLCADASTVSNGCSGVCTGSWTVTQNSNADLDCNNKVSDLEVLNFITKWTSGQITDSQVLSGIAAWVSS